jgi:hypothetical protein
MIIAIDFEGTLHDGTYPVIGNPLPHAVSSMKKIKNKGHSIIITTCRSISLQNEMIKWMQKHEIPYDAINDNLPEIKVKFDNPRKTYADVYIDNKNILGIPSWDLVYDLIVNKSIVVSLHRYLPFLLKNKI